MADSSFDIVSKIDRQEVDNALNQTAKEIGHRFDFKGTGASIAWSGKDIEIRANTEERAKAVLDVLRDKIVFVENSGEIEVSVLPFDDPKLPKVSFSPVAICQGPYHEFEPDLVVLRPRKRK